MIDQLIDLMKRRGYTVVDSIEGNSWEFSVKDLERADMFLSVNSDWKYCTKPVMKDEYLYWRMGK